MRRSGICTPSTVSRTLPSSRMKSSEQKSKSVYTSLHAHTVLVLDPKMGLRHPTNCIKSVIQNEFSTVLTVEIQWIAMNWRVELALLFHSDCWSIHGQHFPKVDTYHQHFPTKVLGPESNSAFRIKSLVLVDALLQERLDQMRVAGEQAPA